MTVKNISAQIYFSHYFLTIVSKFIFFLQRRKHHRTTFNQQQVVDARAQFVPLPSLVCFYVLLFATFGIRYWINRNVMLDKSILSYCMYKFNACKEKCIPLPWTNTRLANKQISIRPDEQHNPCHLMGANRDRNWFKTIQRENEWKNALSCFETKRLTPVIHNANKQSSRSARPRKKRMAHMWKQTINQS